MWTVLYVVPVPLWELTLITRAINIARAKLMMIFALF